MRKTAQLFSFAALLALSGCSIGGGVRAERELELRRDLGTFETLEVRTQNGRVEVQGDSETGEVVASVVKHARGKDQESADAHVEQVSVEWASKSKHPDVLQLAVQIPEAIKRYSPGAHVTLRVPARVALVLRSSNGSIKTYGILGDVDLRTSNGKVEARGIEGTVVVRTSNGAVELGNVTGNLVDVQTSNGKVEAYSIGAASSRVRTANGSIEFVAEQLPEGSGLDMKTSNGSVSVQLPTIEHGEIALRTSNGRVKVDLGGVRAEVQTKKKSRYEARIGSGGPPIRVETSNGGITFESTGLRRAVTSE